MFMARNFKYQSRPTLPVGGRFPSLEVISAGFQSGPGRMLLSRPAGPAVAAAVGRVWVSGLDGNGLWANLSPPTAQTLCMDLRPRELQMPPPVPETVGACPVPSVLTPTWPGLSCLGCSCIRLPTAAAATFCGGLIPSPASACAQPHAEQDSHGAGRAGAPSACPPLRGPVPQPARRASPQAAGTVCPGHIFCAVFSFLR